MLGGGGRPIHSGIGARSGSIAKPAKVSKIVGDAVDGRGGHFLFFFCFSGRGIGNRELYAGEAGEGVGEAGYQRLHVAVGAQIHPAYINSCYLYYAKAQQQTAAFLLHLPNPNISTGNSLPGSYIFTRNRDKPTIKFAHHTVRKNMINGEPEKDEHAACTYATSHGQA